MHDVFLHVLCKDCMSSEVRWPEDLSAWALDHRFHQQRHIGTDQCESNGQEVLALTTYEKTKGSPRCSFFCHDLVSRRTLKLI